MSDRILFVDDDPGILAAFQRQYGQLFALATASDGERGLESIVEQGPFKVIVSDLKMPGMNGIQFLAKASELAPESVRMLLTGYADLENALEAVNKGHIFRFLTKPCPPEQLLQAVRDGIAQYNLVLAGKELESLKQYKKAMESIIAGFSKLVEARDPYTAGHQRRVSELSMAIGKTLDYDVNHLDALRIAGLLHDIGKVYVPSDFLNRPGHLRPEEMAVIRLHPDIGSEILAKVDFEWPIATFILQHHERLDGSGYPKGLKGGEILIDSRILAAADVIDAMSSHRPYRPSHGVNAALRELRAQRGIGYDPVIVDICLELFQDKVFRERFEGMYA